MAQQLITVDVTNGEQAADIINGNFTELYNSLTVPIKLKNVQANTQQAIAANTKVLTIDISGTAGSPTLRIGTTPNGIEIMDDTEIGNSQPVNVDLYFPDAGTIYFTLSGGTVSIRIAVILNFF